MPAARRCGPVFAHVSSDWQKGPFMGGFPRRGTPVKRVVWDFPWGQKDPLAKSCTNLSISTDPSCLAP